MGKSLSELAQIVGGVIVGDAGWVVDSVATLAKATPQQVSFLSNTQYKKYLKATSAGAVILTQDNVRDCPTNALVVTDPYVSYAKIATVLNPSSIMKVGVHASAVVAESAVVATSAYIGPQCVVGENVVIEENVYLGPGSVIEPNCRVGRGSHLVARVTLCHGTALGERCLVHPGVVIGSDGFGVANDRGKWIKVPQLGSVRIGNDVEIGANTTIDRGALDDTIIEDGVKLDNLIQVAHNVVIGAHTVIAGCVGIAGSAVIGKHCAIGGGVGVVGHLQIADGVQVTAMSMVTKSIKEPGVYSSGVPLQSNQEWHKNAVRFKQLDELAKKVKELESAYSRLSKQD